LNQQFAVTIAVSVLISAFNALSLSPALAAILLRPKTESKGLLARAFAAFNRGFEKTTNGYVRISALLIRRLLVAGLILLGITVATGFLGKRLPTSFLPEEDQGIFSFRRNSPTALLCSAPMWSPTRWKRSSRARRSAALRGDFWIQHSERHQLQLQRIFFVPSSRG